MTTSISEYYLGPYSNFLIYLGNTGLFQVSTFQGWKYQIWLYKKLQMKNMHGDLKKGSQLCFSKISIIFQIVNSKWHF